MAFQTLLFHALGAALLAFATAAVTLGNMVRAALCLILSFFTAAMLWMLLEAEFLSILLVLVYVGAVLVLFLFVVMMIERHAPARRPRRGYRAAALAVAAVMAAEIGAVLVAADAGPAAAPAPAPLDYSNTRALGSVLYTDYALALEAAAVALLVAIVGAIALTLRARPDHRRQDPARQSRARKRDRLRLTDGRTDPPC